MLSRNDLLDRARTPRAFLEYRAAKARGPSPGVIGYCISSQIAYPGRNECQVGHLNIRVDCEQLAQMAASRLFASGKTASMSLRSSWSYNHLSRVQRLTTTTSIPKVNKDRLWADIHHTCQFGQGERWGP